ncbi:BTAD domain-containing putative transcriptional regulator [Kutzneria buriramensis]|uniref:BTAD domain-containing putative transcriptional regulator n=1 Tax=Kutzneria buriramensis TaxID=1045776 RepID=UPI0014775245|nr:BTAD domain-containing putative transcriptional regulator [Kutzneria buriramensis]
MDLRLLGTVEARVRDAPIPLGSRQQRLVLAILAWQVNKLVTVDRLVDLVWSDEPPRRSSHAVRVHVSQLRRAFDEAGAGRDVIVTQGPGYVLRLEPGQVDVHRFQDLLRQARGADADSVKIATLDEALALWRGPALADVAPDDLWKRLDAGLEESRLAAVEDRFDAMLRLARHREVVDELTMLVRTHPDRERLVGQLMRALHLDGRTGDALELFRRTKEHLADELGVDPGHQLQGLHLAILRADPALDPPTRAATVFAGRREELAALHLAARSMEPGLVAGDAGSGKSALLERFRDDLVAQGWLVLVGRCPESEGSLPSAAWRQPLAELAKVHDPGPQAAELAPLLDDGDVAGTRSRLHRALVDWLARTDGRTAIAFDDLHRADVETLALIRSVVQARVRVLLVATYRPHEVGAALAHTLAVLAARSPHRVQLGGVDADAARMIVDAASGQRQDDTVVAALLTRTEGNPFYLKECARLLSGGEAMNRIPDGVQDILRHRFALLSAEVVGTLRFASILGRAVDIDLLLRAAVQDEETVLHGLESGVGAGLLTEPRPGWLRFSHVLVREALYAQVPAFRRRQWHSRVADAVAELHPDDVAAVAHHQVQAAVPRTAGLAARHAAAAAEHAARHFAHDTAADWYRQALSCLDLSPDTTDADRVDLLGRLTREYHAAGENAAALDARAQAFAIAERSGRDDLLTSAIGYWDHPTSWVVRPYARPDVRLMGAIERLLGQSDLSVDARCRLLTTVARDHTSGDIDRAIAAADEALTLARVADDPELLCVALAMVAETRAADLYPDDRPAIDTELMSLARRHELVTYEAHAHILAAQTATTRLEIERAAEHVSAARSLAERYHLRPQMIYVHLAEGMLAHIAGRLDDAERHYAEAGDVIRDCNGIMPEVYRLLGVTDVWLTRGRAADAVGELRVQHGLGHVVGERLAIALAAAGRWAQAREVRRPPAEMVRNFLWSRRIGHRMLAAVALGERDEVAALYDELLPYGGGLAGGACGAWVLGPMAQILGEAARLLGRRTAAGAHFQQAEDVAARCEAPLWAARARRARAGNRTFG